MSEVGSVVTDSTYYWQGRLVRLRPIQPEDGETHWLWNQDSEMQRRLERIYPPQSREAARRWAEDASTRQPDGDNFHFEVENLAGELAGIVTAHHCEPRSGNFEISVAMRAEHRRKGYAAEALTMLLRYYFKELRYVKANARVMEFNEPSQRLIERLGFQPEGRLRRMVYTNGRHWDMLAYGMTAEEFAERFPTTF